MGYFLFALPAVLLMLWAQWRVHSAFAAGMKVPASLTGAQAARHILDQSGLHNVRVEMTAGMLSDHYDPSSRVVRLSPDVYRTHSASAVGIAAHETGHALQHARGYAPLVIRNAAVPCAMFGPTLSMALIFFGAMFHMLGLVWIGIIVYAGVLFFQLVNLPVEFDASARAKRMLNDFGMVDGRGAAAVNAVLNAAAWTYVAATLQTLLTLLYYVLRFSGSGRDSR